MKKRLFKSRKNRIIGGVCAGIAAYFNVDPTIVRCIALILGFFKGFGLLAYLVLWIIMPYDESEDYYNDEDIDNMKRANPEGEEKRERSSSAKKKNHTIHSDEEFNDFFKK